MENHEQQILKYCYLIASNYFRVYSGPRSEGRLFAYGRNSRGRVCRLRRIRRLRKFACL